MPVSICKVDEMLKNQFMLALPPPPPSPIKTIFACEFFWMHVCVIFVFVARKLQWLLIFIESVFQLNVAYTALSE